MHGPVVASECDSWIIWVQSPVLKTLQKVSET